jgi:hypothetical protein
MRRVVSRARVPQVGRYGCAPFVWPSASNFRIRRHHSSTPTRAPTGEWTASNTTCKHSEVVGIKAAVQWLNPNQTGVHSNWQDLTPFCGLMTKLIVRPERKVAPMFLCGTHRSIPASCRYGRNHGAAAGWEASMCRCRFIRSMRMPSTTYGVICGRWRKWSVNHVNGHDIIDTGTKRKRIRRITEI